MISSSAFFLSFSACSFASVSLIDAFCLKIATSLSLNRSLVLCAYASTRFLDKTEFTLDDDEEPDLCEAASVASIRESRILFGNLTPVRFQLYLFK